MPMEKKILMVVPMVDFADAHYELPRRVWEERGHRVTVASLAPGVARGTEGTGAPCDYSVDNIKYYDYDAVVFVGGDGTRRFFDDRTILKLATDAKFKILGATGNAVAILALAGVLENKQATGSTEVAGMVVRGRARYTGQPLEVAEKLVTTDGSALEQFANAIADALEG